MRFGSLRGQSFVIPNGENDIPFGKLSKIDYPKIVFSLFQEANGIVKELVERGGLRIIAPDSGDLTGETEKKRQMSTTSNSLDSRNWESFGETLIGW